MVKLLNSWDEVETLWRTTKTLPMVFRVKRSDDGKSIVGYVHPTTPINNTWHKIPTLKTKRGLPVGEGFAIAMILAQRYGYEYIYVKDPDKLFISHTEDEDYYQDSETDLEQAA